MAGIPKKVKVLNFAYKRGGAGPAKTQPKFENNSVFFSDM